MSYRLIKPPWHLRVCPLSSQNPRKLPPTLLRLLKVAYHRKTFIVSRRQHPPQVAKCHSFFIGSLCASKARSKLSLVSASASRRLLLSSPLEHCAVAGCRPCRARLGTSMSHRAHRGWGKFPSSRITTVSSTCRIYVLVATLPGHPATGQLCGPPFAGKVILKLWGPVPVARVLHCWRISDTLPCWVIIWIDRDPAANNSPHAPHATCTFNPPLYKGPYPVTLLPYAASDSFPAAW